jgi:hypothetical protein
MLHKRAFELIRLLTLLCTEEHELEPSIDIVENSWPSILETVEKLDPAFIKEQLPQGLAALIGVDTARDDDPHAPLTLQYAKKLFKKQLVGIDIPLAQGLIAIRIPEIFALLLNDAGVALPSRGNIRIRIHQSLRRPLCLLLVVGAKILIVRGEELL